MESVKWFFSTRSCPPITMTRSGRLGQSPRPKVERKAPKLWEAENPATAEATSARTEPRRLAARPDLPTLSWRRLSANDFIVMDSHRLDLGPVRGRGPGARAQLLQKRGRVRERAHVRPQGRQVVDSNACRNDHRV